MPRPPYKVTEDDLPLVRGWLDNAVERGDIPFGAARQQRLQANTPELLQAWCDDYLDPKDWERLKRSLRKLRQRAKSRPHPEKEKKISIKNESHDILIEIAEQTGLSYHETIKTFLAPLLHGDEVISKEGKRLSLHSVKAQQRNRDSSNAQK